MRVCVWFCAAVLLTRPALPQDPVEVDPKHHTVLLQNDRVRILRASYGSHEKIGPFEHPDSVIVPLTHASVK